MTHCSYLDGYIEQFCCFFTPASLQRYITNCFVLECASGSKTPLTLMIMTGMKENDFILMALCQNGVSGVADGRPWFACL